MPDVGAQLDSLFAQVRKEGAARSSKDIGDRAGVVRAMMMPKQAVLEKDPARRVAVRSARRSGKSTGMLYITLVRCLEQPGARWVVICLTRTSSALRDFWNSLQVISESFELKIRFNKVELSATFSNGSSIRFVGADNVTEIEKLRGSQYDGVIIDECKSFDESVFEELIQDVIEPALMDRSGALYVIGTPGDHLAGPFYLATTENAQSYTAHDGSTRLWNAPYGCPSPYPALWSLHEWSLQDNVTQFENKRTGEKYTLWDKAIQVKADRGWGDDHPTWRREYLGHWVATDTKFVYRYRADRHDHPFSGKGPFGLPGATTDVWKRVVGMDLGTRDGTAIVVWAYRDEAQDLYELYSEKRTASPGQRLPVSAIAQWFKDVEAEYGPFEVGVCDPGGLATMVIDTLADDHAVYLEIAEKREKNDYIVLFNTELDGQRIHFQPGSPLTVETSGNRWDLKKLRMGKREEDRATPNDLCDAALYAFRWCRHRNRAKRPSGPAIGTAEWWHLLAANEMNQARKDARSSKDPNASRLDAEWWK